MREATDLGISAGVRRELAGRRIDLGKIKFPVKAGVVTLQGELCFVGIEKNIDETAVELKFIESSLKMITGVQGLAFELTNWAKNDSGVWESTEATAGPSSSSSASSSMAGDGFVCPDCDYVIRFCPCCGKPLTAAGKQAARGQRKPGMPMRPVIKKKKPFTSFSSPVIASPVASPSDLLKKSPSISSPEKSQPALPPVKPFAAKTPTPPVRPAMPTVTTGAPPVIPAKPATQIPNVKPAPAQVASSQPRPATPPVSPKTPAPSVFPTTPAAPAPARPSAPPQTPDPRPVAPKVPAAVTPASGLTDHSPDFAGTDMESADSSAETMAKDDIFADLMQDPQPAAPGPATRKTDHSGPVSAKEVPAFNFDDLLSSSETEPGEPDQTNNEENSAPPSFDLGALGDFDAPLPPEKHQSPAFVLPTAPADDADLLPPLKITPTATKTPAEQLCKFESPAADPFDLGDDTPLPPIKPEKPANSNFFDDDTPLPPMKPSHSSAPDPMSFVDEDTPLPPMKPKAPAGKEHKDPFAALFSETEMNINLPTGSNSSGKDPFSSLDLDLDVLEVFPSSDSEPVALPAKKPAPGTKKPAPVDDNPFNIDNVIDLDSPVDNKAKSKPKASKDPFDLDDFDISKFKL